MVTRWKSGLSLDLLAAVVRPAGRLEAVGRSRKNVSSLDWACATEPRSYGCSVKRVIVVRHVGVSECGSPRVNGVWRTAASRAVSCKRRRLGTGHTCSVRGKRSTGFAASKAWRNVSEWCTICVRKLGLRGNLILGLDGEQHVKEKARRE